MREQIGSRRALSGVLDQRGCNEVLEVGGRHGLRGQCRWGALDDVHHGFVDGVGVRKWRLLLGALNGGDTE
eukprot:scaffold164083_cov30-Tisochrysis_lutea.AAC.3